MPTSLLTDAEIRGARVKAPNRLELWDEQQPGLCLRVSATRKIWLVRYRVGAKQRRYAFAEYPTMGLADARVEAATILRDARKRGADPAAEHHRIKAEAKSQPIRTLRDLTAAYVLACENGHWKPRGKVQSERTMRDLNESLDRYVLPALGDHALADLDRRAIRSFARELADRGVRAQANKAVSAIRRAYSWAIAEFDGRLVSVNVAAHHAKEPEAPRVRTLRDGELKTLWAALNKPGSFSTKGEDGEPQPLRLARPTALAIMLCATTLQRPVEVAGMMVSELDLDQGLWLVPAARMKARRPHLVPLCPRSVKIIREALTLASAQRPGTDDKSDDAETAAPADTPVFPSPRDRSQPIQRATLSQALAAVARAADLEGVRLYDLRRTGSTALTSERIGVAPLIRSQVLAHTTDTGGGAAVSARHYDANSYVREKRAALAAWEGLLLEITEGVPRPSTVTELRPALAAAG